MQCTARLITLTILSLLSGCQKSDTTTDTELRSRLVGDWVPLASPPSNDARDICATDATMSLESDGDYEGLFDRGRWQFADGRLTVSVTYSNENSGGEGPEHPLDPPHVLKFALKGLEGQVLTAEMDSAPVWLFRCRKPDAF
jgi:hypothetical protein